MSGARRIALCTAAAAVVVFCGVQDRITAAGARRYVALQREAIAGRGPAVTLDEVMSPAIHASVRQALTWSGVIGVVGFSGAALVARKGRRG